MADKTDMHRQRSPVSSGEVALAYIGSIVPDEPRFHNAAFNPSGQMYQRELLLGLKGAGMPASPHSFSNTYAGISEGRKDMDPRR